jgi:Rrf2 family protein
VANSRFALAVHALAYLAHHDPKPTTSEAVAKSINTNPVVVRRLFAQLNTAGLIATQPGVGGGATLTRSPKKISLGSVYAAVSETPAIALHRNRTNQRCPVGKNMTGILGDVSDTVDTAIEKSLSRTSVADVLTKTLSKN